MRTALCIFLCILSTTAHAMDEESGALEQRLLDPFVEQIMPPSYAPPPYPRTVSQKKWPKRILGVGLITIGIAGMTTDLMHMEDADFDYTKAQCIYAASSLTCRFFTMLGLGWLLGLR